MSPSCHYNDIKQEITAYFLFIFTYIYLITLKLLKISHNTILLTFLFTSFGTLSGQYCIAVVTI